MEVIHRYEWSIEGLERVSSDNPIEKLLEREDETYLTGLYERWTAGNLLSSAPRIDVKLLRDEIIISLNQAAKGELAKIGIEPPLSIKSPSTPNYDLAFGVFSCCYISYGPIYRTVEEMLHGTVYKYEYLVVPGAERQVFLATALDLRAPEFFGEAAAFEGTT